MKTRATPSVPRTMRLAAWFGPFLLLLFVTLTGAIKALVDARPFEFRVDGPHIFVGFLIGQLFAMQATHCRDESEFFAALRWYAISLGLQAVTVALLIPFGAATWDTVAVVSFMLVLAGVACGAWAHFRWEDRAST